MTLANRKGEVRVLLKEVGDLRRRVSLVLDCLGMPITGRYAHVQCSSRLAQISHLLQQDTHFSAFDEGQTVCRVRRYFLLPLLASLLSKRATR
jgi:hypothetical protein